jgi:hypothetical protein
MFFSVLLVEICFRLISLSEEQFLKFAFRCPFLPYFISVFAPNVGMDYLAAARLVLRVGWLAAMRDHAKFAVLFNFIFLLLQFGV